jgi:hypothetical protein
MNKEKNKIHISLAKNRFFSIRLAAVFPQPVDSPTSPAKHFSFKGRIFSSKKVAKCDSRPPPFRILCPFGHVYKKSFLVTKMMAYKQKKGRLSFSADETRDGCGLNVAFLSSCQPSLPLKTFPENVGLRSFYQQLLFLKSCPSPQKDKNVAPSYLTASRPFLRTFP